jgi:gluconolactonase
MQTASPLLAGDVHLEQLWTGGTWLEGPVYVPASKTVRFSDIPNNRIMQFSTASGETTIYRDDAEFSNGRTLDLDANVVQCSQGRRAIERDIDGTVHVVVDRFGSGRFNSPNDVVVASDGSIWFTDPPYGLHPSGREGRPGPQDYDGCFVFRVSPDGVPTVVITDMVYPNGLAFSPDESLLYVSDTGPTADDSVLQQIRVYDVVDRTARNGRMFVETDGVADGFRVDVTGRVWTSSGSGIQVFAPDGEPLLDVPVPETVSNLCFGGEDGTELYLTATTSLYRLHTATTDNVRR